MRGLVNYYNDIDPYAAGWLRNLIAAGALPPGDVDDRSIEDVRPEDLEGYIQCHWFAGIGGWPFALQLAGWPEDEPAWTGSCPCQPFSGIGKRKGESDSRHLWPAFYSRIAERQPSTVFGEQVASKLGREWLNAVRLDMEGMEYAFGAADLCAAGVGAPHVRQRLFFVGDSYSTGRKERVRIGGVQQDSDVAIQGQAAILAGPSCAMADTDDAERRAVDVDRQDGCDGKDGGREEACVIPGACGEVYPWSNAVLIPCIDGKWRPAPPPESSLFPLAYGVSADMGSDRPGEDSPFRTIKDPKTGKSIGQEPWRVGLLRGYGNAIVPQLAAKFIRSYMEASGMVAFT